MTSYCLQLKRGKYRINNISGNMIEAVFLKLGIINVHHGVVLGLANRTKALAPKIPPATQAR